MLLIKELDSKLKIQIYEKLEFQFGVVFQSYTHFGAKR